MEKEYRILSHPKCNPDAVVQGDRFRFTVLTPQLIRMEYSANGCFEDRATQTILNRNFSTPFFHLDETDDQLEITTQALRLRYDKKQFSPNGLEIHVGGGVSEYQSVWRYGDQPDTLGGTARTLDAADGAVPLEAGILSRLGFSVIDDSRSLVLSGDGWVAPRANDCMDLYFFGYGHQYKACLKDFYFLCGKTPLLPRYALGNWWSRFHRYTAEEYKELICRFQNEKIPFSVAVIDMDWHLTDDVDPKYGSGWTGYSWNTKLFPDPQEFLAWLHEQDLKVTLNVHPADGIRAYETAYPRIADAMGVDTSAEEPVQFDVTNKKFLKAFFEYVNRPLEEQGVDFWWIDWQQGSTSKIPGLDPLWMLNHYYFLNCKNRGIRPMILSRYAGFGSHRYPIGFSGDTYITWESLKFQPYFTVTASNAGYGWWSHDIGGHMRGYRDDELAVRWVQFGVFSPINRLHSSASPFNSKEPWQYNQVAETVMKRYLQLRHAMIPYLYSMNRRASREGEPLTEPMYYAAPEIEEAYAVPNQYRFGTELMVCPITEPMARDSQSSCTKAWLPEGLWVDFFNSRAYDGSRTLALWRGLEDIPVLAKAGAIVPMAALATDINSVANPVDMHVKIFAGAGGSFTIWEDGGNTPEDLDGNWANTLLVLDWSKKTFIISPADGNLLVLPQRRSWTLSFVGFENTQVTVEINGKAHQPVSAYDSTRNTLTVSLPQTDIRDKIMVSFEKTAVASNNLLDDCFSFLQKSQMEFERKEKIMDTIQAIPDHALALASLACMHLPESVYGPLCEILTARAQCTDNL